MKKIIFFFVYTVTAIVIFPQSMVIQKNDSTNLFIDLNSISQINFIIPCPETPTVDYAGTIYNTIQMGNQCWLKENLNVGTRRDGWVNQTNNSTIEKWCYDNSEDSCTKYGGLYHWNEAMQYSETVGAKGICPIGWHIPTVAEYQTLAAFVDNESNSIKAIGQGIEIGIGTDVTGFSGLLAGGKWYDNSGFVAKDGWGSFWISQVGSSSIYSWTMRFESNNNTIFIQGGTREEWGLSVRCIKD